MNSKIIEPLNLPIKGEIEVSGDKSISHRSILFSAMANGTSHVSGVLDSADVRASIDAVKALGAKCDLKKEKTAQFQVRSLDGGGRTCAARRSNRLQEFRHNCASSNGNFAPWNINVEITGDESLCSRPMRRIVAPLMLMGAKFAPEGAEFLPITVSGNINLKPLEYESPMASAQLKSAVLLAGVFANGTTSVREPAQSRTHTELMLAEYGVQTVASSRFASVQGPAQMHASDVRVPGDASSVAFIACLAVLLKGSDVKINHVLLSPSRTGFLRTLERMGAKASLGKLKALKEKKVLAQFMRSIPRHKGCEVPAKYFATIIDEVPILSLVASRAKGISVIRGCAELRAKESDRVASIIDGLTQLGASAWTHGDDLFIEGDPDFELPDDLCLPSSGDHRMALTWTVAALSGKKAIEVENFDCIDVSYPNFLNDVDNLGKGA